MCCHKLFLIQVNKASTSLFFPHSSLMSVANFSAWRSKCKGAGQGPAQGTRDSVGSLPCPGTAAKPAQLQPCCKGLPVPPSSETVPGWGLTPTAASRAPVSKPASRWHGGWCGARLPQVPPAHCRLCLLMPGQGPDSPPAHCRSLHLFPYQCATARVSQSGAAGESHRQAGSCHHQWASSSQARGNCTGTGVKCSSLTLLPGDGDEDRWPCCEGTAAHSQHICAVAKAGICPSSAVPSG